MQLSVFAEKRGFLIVKVKNITLTTINISAIAVIYHSGDDCNEDPPVPIPNTEVKLINA